MYAPKSPKPGKRQPASATISPDDENYATSNDLVKQVLLGVSLQSTRVGNAFDSISSLLSQISKKDPLWSCSKPITFHDRPGAWRLLDYLELSLVKVIDMVINVDPETDIMFLLEYSKQVTSIQCELAEQTLTTKEPIWVHDNSCMKSDKAKGYYLEGKYTLAHIDTTIRSLCGMFRFSYRDIEDSYFVPCTLMKIASRPMGFYLLQKLLEHLRRNKIIISVEKSKQGFGIASRVIAASRKEIILYLPTSSNYRKLIGYERSKNDYLFFPTVDGHKITYHLGCPRSALSHEIRHAINYMKGKMSLRESTPQMEQTEEFLRQWTEEEEFGTIAYDRAGENLVEWWDLNRSPRVTHSGIFQSSIRTGPSIYDEYIGRHDFKKLLTGKRI